MKKYFVTLLFVLTCTVGFSQQIAIPYRDGNKWGICNEKSEILIEPKFDKIDFYENYSSNYQVLISKVNNLKGLIIDGKEILPPVYDLIYDKGNNYIVVKTENNQKKTDVILPNGTSIFTKPISEILKSENFSDRFQLFHVLNTDNTESVFIFDPTKNTISQWLYENYFSLDLLKMKSLNTINFKVKKTENDGLVIESWDFSNLPNELKKSKTIGKSEADLVQLFMKKSYGKKGQYYDSSGSGSVGEDRVEVVEGIRGDRDYDLVAVPDIKGEGTPVKQSVYISNSFKIENDKLVAISQNQYVSNGPKKTIPIKWKIPVKDIEIKGYSVQEKKSDTTFYYNNAVVYKKNNRKGFLYSADTKNTIEFDTITKFVNALTDEKGTDLVFIVGNKDAKTNQLKFGFYSFKKKLLTPVKYDKLTPTTLMYPSGEKTFFTQENDKFGIISNSGKEIVKTDNDEIIPLNSSSSSTKIIQIKKNNKYSFVYQKYGNVMDISSVKFDYPAKNIIFNYPGFKSNVKSEDGTKLNAINLIELIDSDGNPKGFADSNGTLFYKN
jgi:hypothetical protein